MGHGKKDQVRRAALGVASAALCFSLSSVRPELGAAGPTCGDIATLRIPGITVTTADDDHFRPRGDGFAHGIGQLARIAYGVLRR